MPAGSIEPRIRAFDYGARSKLKRPVKRDTIFLVLRGPAAHTIRPPPTAS